MDKIKAEKIASFIEKGDLSCKEIAGVIGVSEREVVKEVLRIRPPGSSPLSDKSKKEIVTLRDKAWSTANIAYQTGLTYNQVKHFLSKSGIRLTEDQVRQINRVSPENEEKILSMRRSGVEIKEISRMLSLTLSSVKWVCQKSSVRTQSARTPEVQAQWDLLKREDLGAKALEMKAAGHKVKAISEALGVGYQVLSRFFEIKGARLAAEQRSLNCKRPSSYSWKDIEAALHKHGMSLAEEPTGSLSSRFLNVRCRCGDTFSGKVYDFLYGKYNSCGCIRSQPQIDLTALVSSWGIRTEKNNRKILNGLELDIYLPDLKIAIEYCGLFWHGEKLKGVVARTRHLHKLKLCEAAGVRLITIFADEWLCRRNAVEGYPRAILKVQSKKIGARKLSLVKGDLPAVRDFQEENHIQGHSGSDAYSLRDESGKILSSATFLFVNGEWQLVRYCTATDTQVLGGFQRLLKAFIEDHKPEKIVTFSDRRWSVGDTYLRNGFVLDAEIKPSYWYFIRKDDTERLHKSGFRKEKIEKKLGPLLPGETEWEAMQRFGYDRIWDCGLKRWVLTLPLDTSSNIP